MCSPSVLERAAGRRMEQVWIEDYVVRLKSSLPLLPGARLVVIYMTTQ